MILGLERFRVPIRAPRTMHRGRALTLIEVLLAVVIVAGLLLAVLVFYGETARLRDEIESSTGEIAAARHVLGRLTSELATAVSDPEQGSSFLGESERIAFLTRVATVGSVRTRRGLESEESTTAAFPVTDVRGVTWELLRDAAPQPDGDSDDRLAESIATEPSEGLESAPPPSSPPETVPPGVVSPGLGTPRGIERTELRLVSALSPREGREIERARISNRLRFFRLRYFDGAAWSERWDRPELPLAVEVAIGTETGTEVESVSDTTDAFSPFRRVIRVGTAGDLVVRAVQAPSAEEPR
jgi:hypothetical protein